MIPSALLFLSSWVAGPVTAPPWANGETRLYDTSQIPVLRGDSLPALSFAAPRLSPAGNADTGAYHLDLSGSKSLSVSTGQGGVGVDASLLVNVKGQIARNVFLEGSLSDQNVPVQPEGTTANLREVDNKYLRVYGSQYEYLLGDYLLGYGHEGEDRFSIKADGARAGYAHSGFGVSAQYALSKGVFRSDTLHGVDGQQTGYYLRGADGRTFITVLAGTERIWRNGSLLQRGTDYTIDYAQGRIDFLKTFSVTSENLFSVEFQYTEQSYPHTVVSAEAVDTVGRFRFSARAIQEWDDKNNPAAGTPDAQTLLRYQEIGDSVLLDSAGRPVLLPQRLAGMALAGERDGGAEGLDRFVLLGSYWDRNLYSSLNDGTDAGFSTRYHGIHRLGRPIDQGGFSRLEIELTHEHRSLDFASFHQLVEPRSFRDEWNLDAAVGEKNFDANSARLSVEPRTGLQIGVEGGVAAGKVGDSASAESRRGEAFSQFKAGSAALDVSAEAKLASDPTRRDNYRQKFDASVVLFGWTPKAQLLHDLWLTVIPTGSVQSDLWQPEISLTSPALLNRWVSNSDVNAIYGRSNYGATLPAPQDSSLDVGFSQRLRLLSWGPFAGEAFASRRYHQEWQTQADGQRAKTPENAVYDQAQLDFSASGYPHGYGLQTHYQVTRTAQVPLVNAYQKVDSGKGDYVFDSLLNTYQKVDLGGNYVFSGLQRDTTLGAHPYQDLQWTLHLDLSPGRWPARIGGVLADVDLSLDVATDNQDSASNPLLLPRLTDAQIEAARSGHSHYEPSLKWHDPLGKRSATLQYQRDYTKGAGINAAREIDSRTDAGYRWAWSETWEASWGGTVLSKDRQGLLDSTSASESRVDEQQTQLELDRHLPHSFTLVPSMQYERAQGEDAGLPLNLQGVAPALRLEKGAFYGGRASVEYAAHYLFGEGEGSQFATDGFLKGLTHRVEVLAQTEVQTHLHLNLSYLARLDPHATSWAQKLTAEMRAVF